MGEVHPLPALANNFVTFGSVSKNLRINSKVISIWSSILQRVKNSKLLINNFDMNNKEVKEIMLNRFKLNNIKSKSIRNSILKHLPGIVCDRLILPWTAFHIILEQPLWNIFIWVIQIYYLFQSTKCRENWG